MNNYFILGMLGQFIYSDGAKSAMVALDTDIAHIVMRTHPTISEVNIYNFETTKWELFLFRDPDSMKILSAFDGAHLVD